MKKIAKWGAIALGAVIVIALAGFGVTYVTAENAMAEKQQVTPAKVTVPTDAESIARGEHLVAIRGCVDCHGKDYGGRAFIEDPAIGRFVGTNLTSGQGGVAKNYEDADWVRAIRHGVGPGGKKLLFMPSHEFFGIDNHDLGQMIAYLKSLPPVDRDPGKTEVGPMARVLYTVGELPLLPAEMIDHDAPRTDAPPEGPTAEYGEYLAAGCTGCHGAGFSGGKIPGTPPEWLPASNITPDKETGIGEWSEQEFVAALRKGERPDGSTVNTTYMPIAVTKKLKDHEISAIYKYLKTVPAKAEGNR